MAGQTNTIRDELTGRIRKTTPEEKADLLQDDLPTTPEPSDFIKAFMDEEAPAPEEGPRRPAPIAPDVEGAAETAGAAAGGALGGQPGAFAGGAIAAALASKAAQSEARIIGTPEGKTARTQDESVSTLKDLLAVQQEIQRSGTPTQEPLTNAAGSHW